MCVCICVCVCVCVVCVYMCKYSVCMFMCSVCMCVYEAAAVKWLEYWPGNHKVSGLMPSGAHAVTVVVVVCLSKKLYSHSCIDGDLVKQPTPSLMTHGTAPCGAPALPPGEPACTTPTT